MKVSIADMPHKKIGTFGPKPKMRSRGQELVLVFPTLGPQIMIKTPTTIAATAADFRLRNRHWAHRPGVGLDI